MLVSAAVFPQLSCWSDKYTGIESNDRYAKNMKLQSKNVALGAKQGRSLQITILKQELSSDKIARLERCLFTVKKSL